MPWSPLNLTGLVGFWRADMGVTQSGGNVTAWVDQSSNALPMTDVGGTSPTWGSSLFNGFPGIDFGSGNSATNYLETANLTGEIASSVSQSLWFLAYCRSAISGARYMAVVGQGGGNDYQEPNFTVLNSGPGSPNDYIAPFIQSIGGYGSGFTPTYPSFVLGTWTWNGVDNIGYNAAVEATPVAVTSTIGGDGLAISFGSPSGGVADMIVAAGGLCSGYAMNLTSDIPNLITWANNTFGMTFPGGVPSATAGWAECEW